MARTPKPSGRPRRKCETRKPIPAFVVFTEGEVTEQDYFRPIVGWLKNLKKAEITMEGCGSSPSKLVEKATKYKKKMNSKGQSDFHVWCVFDVEAPDPHADLEEAISKAAQNDVKLAISNPCFELWLILHYQDHEAYINTYDAVALRSSLDGSKDKKVNGALYLNRLSEAIHRAGGLNSMHREKGKKFPHNNPSSDVCLLFQAMDVESL